MHTQVGLPQPIRQHFLLGSNLCIKRCSDPFVEHQKLVDRHRIKVALLHDSFHFPIMDYAIMSRKTGNYITEPQGVPWKELFLLCLKGNMCMLVRSRCPVPRTTWALPMESQRQSVSV